MSRHILPPPPLRSAFVLRVAAVWAFLHGVMAVGSLPMRVPFPRAVVGSPLTTLWLTLAALAVVGIDMWRRRELMFLANLGYSFRHLGLLIAAECVLLDAVLRGLLA